MISPEEDYDTWSLIVTTVEDDLQSFANFLPDIKRLLTSITQTGMLPDPISQRTEEFISLQSNITWSFLNLYNIDESAFYVIIEYFQTILEFCASQLKVRAQTTISLLESCFGDNSNLNSYNPNYEIRNTLIQFFLSVNGYTQMMEIIKSESTSLEIIIKLSELILKIKESIESFNETEFSDTICDIFIRISNSDIRKISVTAIEPLLSKLPKSEKWLSLFVTFLKTDLFDKRLFALKKIDSMLNEATYLDLMLHFLREHIETILIVPPHQEFYPLIGHICVVSMQHDIINFEKIRSFWNNQEFVHQSELNSFYSMFNSISKELPSVHSKEFATLYLHPKTKTIEWVKSLSIVCTNFMVLNYLNEFIELRDELFELGFSEVTNLSLEARRGLVYVSATQINQLLPKLIDEEKVKASIEDVLYFISLTLNSKEKIENTQPIIDFCFKHIDTSPSSSIITSLCTNHQAKIDDSQLSKLMQNPSCLSSLYNSHIINDETMDNYFVSLPKFDSGIAGIFLNYIYSHCNFPLTKLPIPKQELLWDLAVKYESYELCIGIGEIYSRNDGFHLTDSTMINEFLSIFESYYLNSDHNQKQRSYLYKLLGEFIEKFEVNADYDEFQLKRHKSYTNDNPVYINVPQLKRQITVRYGNTVAVAVNKIFKLVGKNQLNSFVNINGQFIVYTCPINKLNCNVEINATYHDYQPNEKQIQTQLVRANIPSIVICHSDLMKSLVNDLKDYGCWQLRVLINKLPTSFHLLDEISNLRIMNSYDFDSLIMINYPYYSIYVLESLFGLSLSFDDLNRTGCISYIISIIPRFKIKSQIYLVLTFLNNLSDTQLNLFADSIFDSLLRVVFSQDFNLSANCLTIIKKLKSKIPPYEEFRLIDSPLVFSNKIPEPKIGDNCNDNYTDELKEFNTSDSTSLILSNVILKFMFGADGNMRISFSSNFSDLAIPLSYFIPHLDKINETNCNSLLNVMSSSLKEPCKELANYALKKFDIQSPIFSFIIKAFREQLYNGQYEQEDIVHIYENIADNFLRADRSNFSPTVTNDAFEVLSKAPSNLLCNKLEAISNVQLTDYDINGDECSVEPTTTGLKNLGMSCFLNATLQQFFGIPCVRKAIISYKEENVNQEDQDSIQNSQFLNEMKKLFGRMRDTVESFVSPINIIDKWITWEGTKLNPRIQQDASEYVQMLIDKLELSKIIPRTTFSGNLVQVIESIDDKNIFRTTRNESFSILSVSISPTLEESFDKIHSPDYLNEYYAEPLNKKIEAKKVEYLGQDLPDHLIIQLKRFKFDYTTYEREKINDPVTFNERIELTKHCFETEESTQNSIYLLSGVIIHIGYSEGGHYISYVKQRDTGNWYEYNDSEVKLITLDYVFRNSNINNQTAYILFYDKENLNEMDDSKLDPELLKEVTERNELSKFYSVFCSSPFELFINEIGKRNDSIMDKQVLLYQINVVPHLLFNQGSIRDIIFTTKDILMNNENLCHFYFDQIKSFKPFLFDSPSYVQRNLQCHVILHPLLKKIRINEETFKKIVDLFDYASVRINNSEQYFMVLYWASKYNVELAEKFEIRKKLENLILSIVQQQKNHENYSTIQESIRQLSNLYSQLNFNWITKTIVKLLPSKEFYEQIENDSGIFKMFILSCSDSREYMKLYDEIPHFDENGTEKDIILNHKQKCEDLVLSLLNKNSLYLSMPLVCGCLFIYFKVKAINIFPSLKFKMNNALSNIVDVAFCYVMLCHNMICDQLLLDYFEDWFIPISLCDNYDARILINHSIEQLIRHTKIKDEIGPLFSRDSVNYPESSFEIATVDHVNSVEMMTKIRSILHILIKNLDKVENLIGLAIPNKFVPDTPEKVEADCWKIDQYQCFSYLQILSVLFVLSKQEIVFENETETQKESIEKVPDVDINRLIEFSHFLINHSHPYDVDIHCIIKALKDDLDDEFIDGIAVTLFSENEPQEKQEEKEQTEVTNNSNPVRFTSRIKDVLIDLVPIIENRSSLKESTAKKYADSLCFSNYKLMYQIQEFVPRLVQSLAKLNKEAICQVIDNDLEKVCNDNIISVLFALKAMNEKRDISKFFEANLNTKIVSFDDYVTMFMECNNGLLQDIKCLFWYLNTGYYSLSTRKAIWKYLTEFDADFLLFKENFSNKDFGKTYGDSIEIEKFLISRFYKEDQNVKNEIVHDLVKMSVDDMNNFSLAYNILKENDIEAIKDKDFIKSLFNKKIGHNGEIFLDYCQNVAFPILSTNEIHYYFASMYDFIIKNIQSYNVILDDPANGAFDYAIENDDNALSDVIVCLEFMIKAKLIVNDEIKQIAKEIISKMSNDEIWDRIKNKKIEKLNEILNEIIII